MTSPACARIAELLPVGPTDLAETAASLRAVLATVDSGELTAGPDQTAWLRGAADALDVVAAMAADPAVSQPWQ